MPFTSSEAAFLATAANAQGGSYTASDVQTMFTSGTTVTTQQIVFLKLIAAYIHAHEPA